MTDRDRPPSPPGDRSADPAAARRREPRDPTPPQEAPADERQTAGTQKARRREYVMISAVAERFQVHPQTIRMYEREGLVTPARSAGNTRLYDDQAIRRLETILNLTRELGVNLAGVEVILNMKDQLEALQEELDELLERTRQDRLDRHAGVERRHALVRVLGGPPTKL